MTQLQLLTQKNKWTFLATYSKTQGNIYGETSNSTPTTQQGINIVFSCTLSLYRLQCITNDVEQLSFLRLFRIFKEIGCLLSIFADSQPVDMKPEKIFTRYISSITINQLSLFTSLLILGVDFIFDCVAVEVKLRQIDFLTEPNRFLVPPPYYLLFCSQGVCKHWNDDGNLYAYYVFVDVIYILL